MDVEGRGGKPRTRRWTAERFKHTTPAGERRHLRMIEKAWQIEVQIGCSNTGREWRRKLACQSPTGQSSRHYNKTGAADFSSLHCRLILNTTHAAATRAQRSVGRRGWGGTCTSEADAIVMQWSFFKKGQLLKPVAELLSRTGRQVAISTCMIARAPHQAS